MSSIDDTYLARIVADCRARLEEELIGDVFAATRRTTSLVRSIRSRRAEGELAVIGEVKRRSPSVGSIAPDVDPATHAAAYAAAGAAGISVLTERDHFGGSLDDLDAVRDVVDVPVLRKDFLIDARQFDVARSRGADVVLLIAAIHEDAALADLIAHAHELDLEVLLEVHDEVEMARAIETEADAIGINNRNLRTFVVDLATTERLAPLVTDGRPVVAESGVKTPEDAARMRAVGVDALLVGEALMRAARPGGTLRSLATATATEAGARA
ncbi:MAG: trpC [Thermoleophilia bacterium]|nr:trpC [Thermoleophilia bacterium]